MVLYHTRAGKKRKLMDSYSNESDDNDEGDNDLPRHATWEENDLSHMHFLLPLKTKFGIVHQSAVLREQGMCGF